MAAVEWQGINDHAAVAWETVRGDDGRERVNGPVGLVFWGPVTWQGLQDLGLSRLSAERPGFPIWRQSEPPSAEQVRRRWAVGTRRRAADSHLDGQSESDDESGSAVEHALRAFLARSEGEEVEDFYARVGEFYLLAHTEFGKPTQALATAAGVPRSTATRWVHQARVRGHLPPTTRGKSRS